MDLRSAPLQDHTLPEALIALVTREANIPQQVAHPEVTPVAQCTYTPSPDFPALPARVEAGLYRIAQEALTNARKHAYAQHIEVTLMADDHQVRLVIQDDGCGFDTDTVTQSGSEGHFGLAGMSERAKLLGGGICIQSEPGTGTCIDIQVPY